MRTIEREIEYSVSFKRDFKKLKNDKYLLELLERVLYLLAWDKELPKRMRDHILIGDWAGYRECHIKPDLLLIYKKTDSDILKLVRAGSHSEIFS